MKQLITMTLAAMALAAAPLTLAASQPQAGTNYQILDMRQPTRAPADKVEVIEFFWYGCPHCYAFQPYLENWLAHKPDNVKFVRVPVVDWRLGKPLARAFYTEKALGVVDKLHDAIFDEFHKKHHLMKTKDDFKQFFVQHGISGKDFENAWDSFSVAMNLKRAAKLQKDYRIMGVPTIAVDGRYKIVGQPLKETPEIVNFLVKKSAK